MAMLTDEQKKKAEPILAKMKAATQELQALGVTGPSASVDGHCGVCCQNGPGQPGCVCSAFTGGAWYAPWNCGRPNCGHSITDHHMVG